MDLLKAEIAKRKKKIQEQDILVPGKKYFKRSDLLAVEAAEYFKRSSEHANLESIGVGENEVASDDDNEGDNIELSHDEIVKRLRERGEPIKLFGELHNDTLQRLKRLEVRQPEILKGFKNDLKDAMDAVDQAYLDEIIRSGSGSSTDREEAKKKATDVKIKDDGLNFEDLSNMVKLFGKGDRNKDHDILLKFYKMVLNQWGKKLNARSLNEKLETRGRLETATYTQTVSYIKPLFRKLKTRAVPEGQLECMVEIVTCLLERNYIRANEAYLEMAIGNAPWPIGATMVGIHARPGREKINDRYVAHVLNDETQRKYIQALKRLMVVVQQLRPNDPSLSVNYDAKAGSMTNYYKGGGSLWT